MRGGPGLQLAWGGQWDSGGGKWKLQVPSASFTTLPGPGGGSGNSPVGSAVGGTATVAVGAVSVGIGGFIGGSNVAVGSGGFCGASGFVYVG